MNNRIIIYALFLFVLSLVSCASKKEVIKDSIPINGHQFIDVTSYGVDKSGKSDCTDALQQAFDDNKYVYIPNGKYAIKKTTQRFNHNPNALYITDKSKVRHIVFEEDAWLIIEDDRNFVGTKNDIIKLMPVYGSVDSFRIDGLKIKMNKANIASENTGLFASEEKGKEIKKLIINDAQIINCTNLGILTYAKSNYFKNIYTEGNLNHAIGARNPYNHGVLHHLEIDNHTSIDDGEYSIDFSGSIFNGDWSVANPNDRWTGRVSNVKSIRSKRGIKTAGYWDLEMYNIQIIEPKVYGFFINKSAPGTTIKIDSMLIRGAKNDFAMSLSGKCNLELDNIIIENCKSGINMRQPIYDINNLTIKGENMEMPLRLMSESGTVNNFIIEGGADEVASIWIKSKKCVLENGVVKGFSSPYGILVHEGVKDMYMSNVTVVEEGRSRKHKVMSMQLDGNLTMVKSDLGKIFNRNFGAKISNKQE